MSHDAFVPAHDMEPEVPAPVSLAPQPEAPQPEAPQPEAPQHPRYALSFTLFALTCASTTYVGAQSAEGTSLASGLSYSVPLMAILLAHEFGHYIAARIHRVPASLPYFIPIPIPPLGTMGAVILMRDRIARRDALFDIGAAGPLAGLVVAVPVLIYGILESHIAPSPATPYLAEGHSLLYAGLLYWLKGPFPPGQDIMLTPTAFAGWTGLLVTMLNLIPALQLDGGHVAYALLDSRYARISRLVRRALLPLALVIAAAYGLPAFVAGQRGDALWQAASPGMQWFTWWLLLWWMARRAGQEHPPVDPGPLSPRRRVLAAFTLGLFVLLFMPAWLRLVTPG
jgi:membrane-associated protease RseP (regulator of RpoE activity)